MLEENVMGIDVSKTWLDVDTTAQGSDRYENCGKDYSKIYSIIRRLQISLVVLEATGGYERKLVRYLSAKNVPLSVTNPRQVRDFARSLGILAKTDALDASLLRKFGETVPQRLYARPSREQEELRAVVQERMHLVRLIAAEKQRLSLLDSSAGVHARRVIKGMTNELKRIDRELEDIAKKNETVRENNKLLCKVKGVGLLTATSLQALLPELGQVTGKQIAALAGLAPYNRDSGKRRGVRCVWGGRERVRTALWMVAVCASTYNDQLRSFYRRLIDSGKPAKVALTAVMRKILIQCNAIVRDQAFRSYPSPA